MMIASKIYAFKEKDKKERFNYFCKKKGEIVREKEKKERKKKKERKC